MKMLEIGCSIQQLKMLFVKDQELFKALKSVALSKINAKFQLKQLWIGFLRFWLQMQDATRDLKDPNTTNPHAGITLEGKVQFVII